MGTKAITVFLVSAIFLLALSCKEDEYAKTATVKFSGTKATYSEDAGTIKVEIKLDRNRNINTNLTVTWSATDTAVFLGGDFEVSSDLTIRAFNTSGILTFNVLDDKQIDVDDVITLKIAKPEGNVKLSDKVEETQFNFNFDCARIF